MTDKRPIGYIPGKAYVLDKKVPKSPKYAHIGPSIDTGRNSSHIQVVSNKSLMNKKGEMFKRIKASTVAHLITKEAHNENICNLLADSESVSGYTVQEEQKSAARSTISQSEYAESLSQYQGSVASKLSVVTYGTEQIGITNTTEFVVVDLRERDEYELYHIKEAVHFPGPAIARDKYPPQIFNLKNKQDKLIILYHQDERHGIPYATGFFEKGFENVFLISGGIESFLEEAPELVEGKAVPSPPKKTKKNYVVLKRSKYMEYPDEGDVVIPSNYLVDAIDENKSIVSGVTSKTSKTAKTLLSKARSQDASPRFK